MITIDDKAQQALSLIDKLGVAFSQPDYNKEICDFSCVCYSLTFEDDDELNKIIDILNEMLESSEKILIDAGTLDNVLYIKMYANFDDFGVFIYQLGKINKTVKFIKHDENFSLSKVWFRENNILERKREVSSEGSQSQGNFRDSVHWKGSCKL